jgi:hypothetical protein
MTFGLLRSLPDIEEIGPEHFSRDQLKWVRDRQYLRGIDEKRPIGSDEASRDYLSDFKVNGHTLREEHDIFYLHRNIIPLIIKGSFNVDYVNWFEARLIDSYLQGYLDEDQAIEFRQILHWQNLIKNNFIEQSP